MTTTTSAQQFLAIDTIHEDIVVLKDGGLKVVLMCSSLNFALKSTDEQEAIIFQFQNLLNSLDFSIQFVIHSRRLNIEPYLETLRNRQREEDNELLKIQIGEYTEFTKTFVQMTNIMAKTFYVAIPFTPAILEEKKIVGAIFSILGFGKKEGVPAPNLFEEHKNQLWQRVDSIVTGLMRLGIRSTPLNTEELVELFYGLYNPTEFEQAAKVTGENV